MSITTPPQPPSQPGTAVELGQPIPFPNPMIRRSSIRRVEVLNSQGAIERRTVIDSGGGRIYEIGAMIKKAIFGQVIRAVQLVPTTRETISPCASCAASIVSEAATATTVSASTVSSTASSAAPLQQVPQQQQQQPPQQQPQLPPQLFRRSDQHRAIKVYSKRIIRSLQGRTAENPLSEITALQFIGDDHPNLMGQIECCTDEENIYSIMRFCNGGEFFDYIDSRGPLNDEQAREMFHQIMDGLAHLQKLGIGHRDMSLENILYDAALNRYIIIDFGMCLRMPFDPVTNSYPPINRQNVCGKKNYISPEIIRGDAVFNPMLSDMWAAGVILFIALTGVPPVDSASQTDNRYLMIANNQLLDMVTAWDLKLDPAVVDLMQNLMRPQPQDRLTIQQVLAHPWMNRNGVP